MNTHFSSLGKSLAVALAAAALWAPNSSLADSPKLGRTPAELRSQVKISEARAGEIALNAVRNGTLKSIELEEEKQILIWSVDIATPETKNISEIRIDAMTGAIVAVEIETPADQKRELDEHKAEGRG